MQKFTNPDFMSTKKMLNNGQQTQYLIKDHHTAIVSVEDWEAAKRKLQHRHGGKNCSENIIKYKKRENTIFYHMFYCGSCGNFLTSNIVMATKKGKKFEYQYWRCRAVGGYIIDVGCNAQGYRKEAMEHAFMAMLLEMKREKDKLIKEVKSAIALVSLDESEIDRMSSLQQEIEPLYKRISQIGVAVKESQVLDEFSETILPLAQEIEILQNEWEELDNKLQNKLLIERNLKWLIKELNALKEFDPTIESIEFRKDIFSRIIKRGVVFDGGIISYELNLGVTRIAKGNDIDLRSIKKK